MHILILSIFFPLSNSRPSTFAIFSLENFEKMPWIGRDPEAPELPMVTDLSAQFEALRDCLQPRSITDLKGWDEPLPDNLPEGFIHSDDIAPAQLPEKEETWEPPSSEPLVVTFEEDKRDSPQPKEAEASTYVGKCIFVYPFSLWSLGPNNS